MDAGFPSQPTCPLCGEPGCPYLDGGHCPGWQVELPEEPVFVTRDRIRAYGWRALAILTVLVVAGFLVFQ